MKPNKSPAASELGNIYWRQIPRGATIEDKGSCWIAHLPGGGRSLVNWGWEERFEAADYLKR